MNSGGCIFLFAQKSVQSLHGLNSGHTSFSTSGPIFARQEAKPMLLADFHVHSSWSDGALPIPEVVDLFGRSGHDVIAITDHVVNSDSLLGKAAHGFGLSVTE
jgi:hypothetical protein